MLKTSSSGQHIAKNRLIRYVSKRGNMDVNAIRQQLISGIEGSSSLAERAAGVNALKALSDMEQSNSLYAKIQSNPVGKMVGMGVGAAAMVGAGLTAISLIDKMTSKAPMVTDQQLDLVLKNRPNLQGLDREKLKEYYTIILRAAPTVSREPMVAGALLERIVNYGGVDHSLMKELAEAEIAMKDSRTGTLSQATGMFGRMAGKFVF